MPFIPTAIAFIARNRWAQIGLLAFVLVVGAFIVGRCSGPDQTAQVRQNNKTAAAVSNAAKDAVNTVVNRSKAEIAIDAATAQAKEEIGNATTPDQLRAAVTRSLCVRPEYAGDPACRVRKANP